MGARFERHGRTPAGIDCLGLVLYVLGASSGRELPDPAAGADYRELVRHFDVIEPEWARSPGDVLWATSGEPHLAVVESARWVLDISTHAGVHRVRREDAAAAARGAYRLREVAP